MKKTRRRFFSLLEMMVVIAIIGALAGMMIVNFTQSAEQANVDITKQTIRSVESVLKMYKLQKKSYPSTDEGLDILYSEKMLESRPLDAWGNPLQYQYPGSRDLPFDIWSLGADNMDGGEGFDADIFNGEEEST